MCTSSFTAEQPEFKRPATAYRYPRTLGAFEVLAARERRGTPQPIVDFICASIAHVLESESGKKLSDPDVVILDPCTGTGNFVVNLMHRVPRRDLPRVYEGQLFADEVMLMPY